MGMGNASACLSDVWSLTNNIAGLTGVQHATAATSCHAIPSFEPFSRMAGVVAVPAGTGVAGTSIFRFGDDLYNEHVLSIGYANTFGLASLGIKFNYVQYRIEGLETITALSASFGGLARLGSHLLFGAHVVNINQPTMNTLTGEKLPTRLVAGIALQQSENIIASAEIEKEIDHSPVIKAGVEYRALKRIWFRTGFNLRPEAGFAGLGTLLRRFQLDYAMQWDHFFGLSHQATVKGQLGAQ